MAAGPGSRESSEGHHCWYCEDLLQWHEGSISAGCQLGRYSLAKSPPNAEVGIGCVIEDVELRNAQFEYARR